MRAETALAARNLTLDPATSQAGGATTLVKFISLGLIIAIGSAANALVIYAFGRYLQLRRPPYSLMAGFVTLDLSRVLVCFPITFITVVHRLHWKYGGELCQLMAFTNVFCLLGNSLSIFGMALDRYLDNRHHHVYRSRFRNVYGTAMLFLVWGMAFLFAFPTVYGVRQRYDVVGAQCTFPHHYYQNDVDTLGLMTSLVVVIILTNVLYVKLFFYLRGKRKMRPVLYEPAISASWGFYDNRAGRSVRQRWVEEFIPEIPISTIDRNPFNHHPPRTNYEMAQWRNQRQRKEEKLTKLCFVIHVIFSVMWLPYISVCFLYAVEFHNPKVDVPGWLEATATWLSYLQVTVTPIAFFSLSHFSRKRLRNANEKQRYSPTSSHSSY